MRPFTEEEKREFSMANWCDLTGRTAVVTGGATGLGLAITRCLIGAGAKVVAVSRGASGMPEALREFGGKAAFFAFDVTDTDRAEEAARAILAEHGPVDILVNNAGNHCKKFAWDMTPEEYRAVLDVHLTGAFALTRAFIPGMRERKWGRILFQASMTSYIGMPMVAGYSSAKAGVLGLVHALTAELAGDGITVNCIAPGWIDTPMFHRATDADSERRAKILGRIPAGSVGDPMDVGMCAAFLCSDAARYITGACIPVDGGGLIGF